MKGRAAPGVGEREGDVGGSSCARGRESPSGKAAGVVEWKRIHLGGYTFVPVLGKSGGAVGRLERFHHGGDDAAPRAHGARIPQREMYADLSRLIPISRLRFTCVRVSGATAYIC